VTETAVAEAQVKNVKLNTEKEKQMKKITTTLIVAAALVASAPLAKANSFLELISGSSSALTTVGGQIVGLNTGVGSWTVNITTGVTASQLTMDLGSYDSGQAITAPLTIIYSSGVYYPSTPGAWELQTGNLTVTFPSGSAGSVSALVNVYASSHGVSAFDTQTITKTLGADDVGNLTGLGTFTEIITITPTFTRGSGVTVSFDSGFSYTTVPDGGMTMAMVGSVLIGLAGIRSKFGKRA